MLKWALDNEGACSWALLSVLMIKENLTTRGKRVLEFNLSHYVTTGYYLIFKLVFVVFESGLVNMVWFCF